MKKQLMVVFICIMSCATYNGVHGAADDFEEIFHVPGWVEMQWGNCKGSDDVKHFPVKTKIEEIKKIFGTYKKSFSNLITVSIKGIPIKDDKYEVKEGDHGIVTSSALRKAAGSFGESVCLFVGEALESAAQRVIKAGQADVERQYEVAVETFKATKKKEREEQKQALHEKTQKELLEQQKREKEQKEQAQKEHEEQAQQKKWDDLADRYMAAGRRQRALVLNERKQQWIEEELRDREQKKQERAQQKERERQAAERQAGGKMAPWQEGSFEQQWDQDNEEWEIDQKKQMRAREEKAPWINEKEQSKFNDDLKKTEADIRKRQVVPKDIATMITGMKADIDAMVKAAEERESSAERKKELYEQHKRLWRGSLYEQLEMKVPEKSIGNIEKDVAQEDIRKAYKKAAFKYHPDRNRGNEEVAAKKFIVIGKAYEILFDAEKRKAYDAAHMQGW